MAVLLSFRGFEMSLYLLLRRCRFCIEGAVLRLAVIHSDKQKKIAVTSLLRTRVVLASTLNILCNAKILNVSFTCFKNICPKDWFEQTLPFNTYSRCPASPKYLEWEIVLAG